MRPLRLPRHGGSLRNYGVSALTLAARRSDGSPNAISPQDEQRRLRRLEGTVASTAFAGTGDPVTSPGVSTEARPIDRPRCRMTNSIRFSTFSHRFAHRLVRHCLRRARTTRGDHDDQLQDGRLPRPFPWSRHGCHAGVPASNRPPGGQQCQDEADPQNRQRYHHRARFGARPAAECCAALPTVTSSRPHTYSPNAAATRGSKCAPAFSMTNWSASSRDHARL